MEHSKKLTETQGAGGGADHESGDVCRQTVFVYRDTVVKEGVAGCARCCVRLGGKLEVSRKSHAKKGPAKAEEFNAELPAKLDGGDRSGPGD